MTVSKRRGPRSCSVLPHPRQPLHGRCGAPLCWVRGDDPARGHLCSAPTPGGGVRVRRLRWCPCLGGAVVQRGRWVGTTLRHGQLRQVDVRGVCVCGLGDVERGDGLPASCFIWHCYWKCLSWCWFLRSLLGMLLNQLPPLRWGGGKQ